MISEKSLGIIVIVCIAAVSIVAVINMQGTGTTNTSRILTVVPRISADVSPDSTFYDDSDIQTDIKIPDQYIQNATPAPRSTSGIPGLTARSFIVGDVDTGTVYMQFESKKILPVASMSKLVTAFVATDMLPDDAIIGISTSSLRAPPDKSNLRVGETYTLGEILHPLLLSSSNVAAEAVSSSTDDRPDFLEAMSNYAWEIGMPDTFFADPSGVSPRNVATAQDIFALARYLSSYRPDILALTRIASTSSATTTEHDAHDFVSTHPFVSEPGFIGGKTGRTPEAGETMVTIIDIQGKPVAIIVLGSRDRALDTRILLEKVSTMIASSQ